MIEVLQQAIALQGDRAAVVPIQRLDDLRADFADLKSSGQLANFQRFILDKIYSLDPPDVDFEARSIIIAASPSPAAIEMVFGWQGRRIPVVIPGSYVYKHKQQRIEDRLNEFLGPRGYQARYAPQLPHKRLAVRSGLARYGRNNICYVEGMGSLLNLTPLVSDLPVEESEWHAVRHMERCSACSICLQSCPTGAIRADRFLLEVERCLTYFNELGAQWGFPAWLDPAAHHSLYGCLRCQEACPANKPYWKTQANFIAFSEAETTLLLEGCAPEQLPEGLAQKVQALDMADYLAALPRNLPILLE